MTASTEQQCHILCRCELETFKNKTVVKNCCTLCFRSGPQGYQEIASISESLKAAGRIKEEQTVVVSHWEELPVFIRLEADWRLTFIQQQHRAAAA
uniref:Uncharacterized protein n=1 Tax=Plectus sambesii TaxID=2011161 RepID=A0A914VEQ7_9BILA